MRRILGSEKDVTEDWTGDREGKPCTKAGGCPGEAVTEGLAARRREAATGTTFWTLIGAGGEPAVPPHCPNMAESRSQMSCGRKTISTPPEPKGKLRRVENRHDRSRRAIRDSSGSWERLRRRPSPRRWQLPGGTRQQRHRKWKENTEYAREIEGMKV